MSQREKEMDRQLTLPEETAVTKEQLKFMLGRTPKKHVYTRPAKGGGTWDYVTGSYVKKVLNYVFAWDWDFKVVEHDVKGDTIYVLGELTVRSKGNSVTKMQFGRADIKYRRGTKEYLDYGNDLKAATTDALKKCASELGIASDVYGKGEFKEISGEAELPQKFTENPDDNEPVTKDQMNTIEKMLVAQDEELSEDELPKTKGEAREIIRRLSNAKKDK